MQKKFITNLFILLFLNLLIKGFWILGIDRSVQNAVGTEGYGMYFAIFNFTFLFNILLDFGITNFNNRNIAQNHHLVNKYVSSILILKFLLFAVYCFITLGAGLIIGYNAHQMGMLGILVINQFLISFVLYLRSNISGLHFFKTDSCISVLDRALMIIICGVLLLGHATKQHFKIEWFIYAQTAAYLITAVVAFVIVVYKSKFRKLSWNRPFFVMIVKQSFPFAILVLLMAFYNRIDSVMLERILPGKTGEQQAGVYASAYRLLDATNMIAYLFSVILLPMFARMLKFKESVEKLARLSFTLLFILSIMVAVGSLFYSSEIMRMLYPQQIINGIKEYDSVFNLRIEQTSVIFGMLMAGFIPISTTYVFGTLLTANGNLKQLNIVAACGMVLNISLNFILIPAFQSIGSAYASLITQFLSAIVQVIIVQFVFKFHINKIYLLKLFCYVAAAILFGFFSRWLIIHMKIDWKSALLILAALCVVFAASVRLLNIMAFFKILKKEEPA
jgi:O-antigen/teichoic acid export membrane protein